MIAATPLDLITVDDAIEWIFGASSSISAQNAGVLQKAISSLSLEFLRRIGRAAQNGSVPAASPLNQAVAYNETYTGNGNELLQLRNFPILSVSSVLIFGQTLPQSSGPNNFGFYIEDSGRYLGYRNGPLLTGLSPQGWGGFSRSPAGYPGKYGWPKGIDCIQVQYSAGFAAQPVANELQTVPAQPPAWVANTVYATGQLIFDGTNVQMCQVVAGNQQSAKSGTSTPSWSAKPDSGTADGALLYWINQGAPYTIVVFNLPWISDSGVSYFSSGDPLTSVQTAPTVGQYYAMGSGVYLFNSADAGQQVKISYLTAGTPEDVQLAMLRWVNLIYKRRSWEGIRSVSNRDGGSTVYTSFEVDPSVNAVIDYYTRRR